MTPGGEISFRIDEPVVLVGAVTFVLWVVVERFLQFLRLSQPLTSERERVSWYWFVVTYYGAFIFPFFDATTLHWSTVGPNLAPARWLGVPLLVAGFGIRTLARLTLGKHFSGYVQTTSEHRLITTGIYGWIRHPAYLGYIFLLFGFPICFGSVGGLGWAIVSGIPTLVYRIRIEEAALGRWFPGEYQHYRSTTHRLLPGLW